MRILCVDIGGSFLKHTLLEDDLKIKEVGKVPTPRDSLESFIKAFRDIYHSYTGIDGIAICSPGVIDQETGFMYTGGSLDYIRNINMRDILSEACDGLPVNIENDGKAAATAELNAGILKDVRSGIVITIGTALGGTVIVDRKIVRGRNLFAGELSYGIYQDDGVRDESWCTENNMWGMRGIPARIVRLYGDPSLRCEDVLERYRQGDPKAEEALRAGAREVALLVHNLQCYIDPDIVAIGGGISEGPDYLKLIREESEKLNKVPLFDGVVPRPRIESCRFFNDANLLGAFYAFREHYMQKEIA